MYSVRSLVLATFAGCALSLAGACKRSNPPPSEAVVDEAEPADSALAGTASPTLPPRVSRCQRPERAGNPALGEASQVTGSSEPGTPAAAPESGDADQVEAEDSEEARVPGAPSREPFAIEVGNASGFTGGFALGFLRHGRGETHALLTLLDDELHSPQTLELGRTFGEVEPPRIAASADKIAVAVPDNDAGSSTLKLALVTRGAAKPNVTWGPTFSQGRDDSSAFDIELGAERGILVWDEFDKPSQHGVVMATSFELAHLGSQAKPHAISPKDADVEGPRLARRPGGFWLGWLAYASAGAARPGQADTPSELSDKLLHPDDPEETPLLDMTPRSLQVVPLDEKGAPVAAPMSLTPPSARVLVYDLAAASDGSAFLAWREDAALAGLEGHVVSTARVRVDGGVARAVIDLDDVGRGVPTLLFDAAPKAPQVSWLSVAGMDDLTRLAAIDDGGTLADALASEPDVRYAEPLTLFGGRLLLADARGPEIMLSVVQCTPAAPAAAPTLPAEPAPAPTPAAASAATASPSAQ